MEVIYKPIMTEKSSINSELRGQYGFFVNPSANKIEIKKAIEDMYGISVKKVRTVNHIGKRKSNYTRTGTQIGRKSHAKKAIVELSAGEEIDFYKDI